MKVIYRDNLGIVEQETAPGTEIVNDGVYIRFTAEKQGKDGIFAEFIEFSVLLKNFVGVAE